MLCIVSAISEEISSLIDHAKASALDQNVWHVTQPDALLIAAGIGCLTSAIHLQSLLQRFPMISRVVFCGSAGVYPGVSEIHPGDLCCCDDTFLCDGAAELGMSRYASMAASTTISADYLMAPDLTAVKAATTFTLTATDELAATIATNTGAKVENMEVFGVASVCKFKRIPWNAVLGITNHVGRNGHEEWKRTFRQVGQDTADYLKERFFI